MRDYDSWLVAPWEERCAEEKRYEDAWAEWCALHGLDFWEDDPDEAFEAWYDSLDQRP